MRVNRWALCLGTATTLLLASVVSAGAVRAAPANSLIAAPAPYGSAAVAPAPTQSPQTYVVKPGDTLSGIADALGVKTSALQDANGLKDPNALRAGMTLTIPAGSAPAATPTPADTKYTVKPGDSLSTIAVSLGVSASAIQSANGIQDPNSIKAGQVLTIPGGAKSADAPAAAQPTPTATPAPVVKYTVKQGDSLSTIALSLGVSASAIQSANGIQDPNSIRAGQVLTIPGAQTQTPVATQPPPASPTAVATPAPTQQPTATPSPTPQPTPAAEQAPQSGDPRSFPQTGYRIANDQLWDYFTKRGVVRTFGYPISSDFQFQGFRVQFFQRLIMQLNPEGTVSTMNLLDTGFMPYTRVNYSTFPAPDPQMAGAAPKVGSPDYAAKLMEFVSANVPDQWNGLPVNFWNCFTNTVRYEEAYPDRKQDPGIMPAINLELWGLPISAPSYDPNNKNFVYLRFQRGIMHFDATTGATQGLLLGDYLKSIVTGINLPPDLDQQAQGSRFYRQYNALASSGVSRPNDLPGTNMSGAFSRAGLVVLDPGHGGGEIGASFAFPNQPAVREKDLNLKVALKTADLLRQAGQQVQLTRTADVQVNNPPRDNTGDGKTTLDDDLQARVDIANNSGAQLFLSIHLNGSSDPNMSGASVYYDDQRPFSDKNKKFAQLVLDSLLANASAAGFDLGSRGVKTDQTAVGMGNSFYVLGPIGEDKPRAGQMVGALAEGAFLSNAHDAALLAQDKFLDAVASAYAKAILQWFQTSGR